MTADSIPLATETVAEAVTVRAARAIRAAALAVAATEAVTARASRSGAVVRPNAAADVAGAIATIEIVRRKRGRSRFFGGGRKSAVFTMAIY